MNRACSVCGGIGYTIGRRAEVAWATACECTERCETCRGERFFVVDEGGYSVAAPCGCLTGLERVRLFNEAQVPAGYADKTIPGFVHRKGQHSLAVAKERFMRLTRAMDVDDSRGVVLVGEPGLGKTHLVCALVNYLTLQRGIACRFVDFFELTQRIRASYGDKGGESEASIIEPLVSVPVLAIDDLGKGRGSNFELTIIDRIITRRYNAGRIVLATTNFFPEAGLRQGGAGGHAERESLEERVGQRLFSRLVEMTDIVHLAGPDFRRMRRARR